MRKTKRNTRKGRGFKFLPSFSRKRSTMPSSTRGKSALNPVDVVEFIDAIGRESAESTFWRLKMVKKNSIALEEKRGVFTIRHVKHAVHSLLHTRSALKSTKFRETLVIQEYDMPGGEPIGRPITLEFKTEAGVTKWKKPYIVVDYELLMDKGSKSSSSARRSSEEISDFYRPTL